MTAHVGGNRFPAMAIRDAVGALADGCEVDPGLVEAVRTAAAGPCRTLDRGDQVFVVDLSGCDLLNVDTEELVWPRPAGTIGDDEVALSVLTDPEQWHRACSHWHERDPLSWVAFRWRIAIPLSRRLTLNTSRW